MKKILIILSILSWTTSCHAQLDTEKKRQLDKLVQDQIEKDSPGLAIGIIKDGKIIYKNYAGLADVPNHILLSDSSRFNYASNGKQFTAIAMMKLMEEGKINLNDDLRKYFPSFLPNVEEPILISHLLNHSSGIRDVYDLWSLQGITWWEITLSNKDAIELLSKQQELNFLPGSKYMYSNSNYILLTEIVKLVTGLDFVEYSSTLFNQLGMNATSFEANHENINQRVRPYGFWKKYREYDWNSDLHGDGSLFTTLPDQLLWECILQNKKSEILSLELIEASQSYIENTTIKNYGYGLEFDEESGRKFHHGSTGAYGATFLRYPTINLSVVVLTNYSNISTAAIAESSMNVLLGKESKDPSFPTGPEKNGPFISKEELIGTYSTSSGYFYKFKKKDGQLYLDRAEREDVALEHEVDNIYHEIADPAFK